MRFWRTTSRTRGPCRSHRSGPSTNECTTRRRAKAGDCSTGIPVSSDGGSRAISARMTCRPRHGDNRVEDRQSCLSGQAGLPVLRPPRHKLKAMVSYIVGRLLYGVLTFLGITIAVFVLVHSVPGDPIDFYLSQHMTHLSQAALDAIRHEHHLDQPVITQYLYWLRGAVTLDFGT